MKIFAAGLYAETNTFSPIPTGLDDFHLTRASDLSRGMAQLEEIVPFGQWQESAVSAGHKFQQGLIAWAHPAGITAGATYESLRDELLDSLQRCDSIDVVLLFLHGAMVAEGYDDCEGDLIVHIREVVGPNVIIAGELDLHCHLSQKMVKNADILISYKEYPHSDIAARADELFELAMKAALGCWQPRMAVFDCKMIGLYPTSSPEMRSFIAVMEKIEAKEDIFSVSFCHGFPFGDVDYGGSKIIVITDNDSALGYRLAAELGHKIFSLRHYISFDSLSLDEAMTKTRRLLRDTADSDGGPIVIADQSDNAGAGAASDSTFALSWLLDHRIKDAAVAIMFDPLVVSLAMKVGVGAKLELRLGGKMGRMSGDPLDLNVEVIAVQKDYLHKFPQDNGVPLLIPIGDVVSLSCDGIHIVVSSQRCQCFSPSVFDDLNIPSDKQKLLIVKSMQHFFGGFAPMAREVIYMAGPGAVSPCVENIDYRRMPTDDKYPWLDDALVI